MLTPNPLSQPMNELAALTSLVVGLASRYARHSIPTVPPIAIRPDLESIERTRALLAGQATAAQIAQHKSLTAQTEEAIDTMRDYVAKWINSRLDCDSVDAIEVELCGKNYAAWVLDNRPGYFMGRTFNGTAWSATTTVVIDYGDSVTLTFRVTFE